MRRAGTELPGTGTAFRQVVPGHGYLLSRTTGSEGMTAPTGFVVGGNLSAEDDAAAVLARLLERTWQRVLSPTRTVVERLRGVEQHFGVSVLPEGFEADGPVDVAATCWSPGRGLLLGHGALPRARPAREGASCTRMAESRGLVAVPNAHEDEAPTCSWSPKPGRSRRKAKNAARWGKPVVTAEEFLEWVG